MCYTLEASIASGSLLIISAIFLVVTNYERMPSLASRYAMAGVLLGLSTMQIAEAIIHWDTACSASTNKFGSRLAFLSLYVLQPTLSASGVMAYGGKVLNFRVSNRTRGVLWIIWFMVWCALMAGLCYGDILSDTTQWCSTDTHESGGLDWLWYRAASGMWPLYASLAFIWPVLHVEGTYNVGFQIPSWLVWVILVPVVHLTVSKHWGSPSRSCYWGPIAALFGFVFLHATLGRNKTTKVYSELSHGL